MKTRTLMFFCILCLAALIVIGSCATTQNPDKMVFERFCGTWANEAYEKEPGSSEPSLAKWIINPDGTFTGYDYLIETGPTVFGSYIVEKRWTDSGGNSLYHVKVYVVIIDGTRYELWRIDKYNAVWEVQWSNIDYPAKIDPKDNHSNYHIHYRF